jgi:hypothetical protein
MKISMQKAKEKKRILIAVRCEGASRVLYDSPIHGCVGTAS